MFFFIDQPCTPYFPIGYVKNKSYLTVRSVKTDLGTLVVAVISVDAYPFLAFLDLACDLEEQE